MLYFLDKIEVDTQSFSNNLVFIFQVVTTRGHKDVNVSTFKQMLFKFHKLCFGKYCKYK